MTYTAIEINALGDHDPKYGQRYWGKVEETHTPVSFNLLNPVAIPIGAKIDYEEKLVKESKKGTEYFFLRKVKVSGGMAVQQPSSDSQKLLELVYEQTTEILQILKSDQPRASLRDSWDKATTKEEDTVADLDPEEEIDIDSIPF